MYYLFLRLKTMAEPANRCFQTPIEVINAPESELNDSKLLAAQKNSLRYRGERYVHCRADPHEGEIAHEAAPHTRSRIRL